MSEPTVTLTFLFTDVEGSTRLWERHPEAMAAALVDHDAVLRRAIAAEGGRVFATGGDAFCAAFATADKCLAAALRAQRDLIATAWPRDAQIKVRMGMHTGAAEIRGEDYFGPVLNRAARILGAGHGGQVLLSLATQELVRDSLPAGIELRDLGERRLKDLVRPERMFQVLAADLPREFAPLRTLDARSHNLPLQLTTFIGREREMREVKDLLRAQRLVTLVGTGGSGKTRLALQASADVIDDYDDGVCLVELAGLRDDSLVAQRMASALGITEQAGVPMLDSLVDAARGRELLFVLDNCEHLLQEAARVCNALLSSAPRLRILATAREPLRTAGEVTYRVPSLATPDAHAALPVDSLSQYAAVQLFIDRALAVCPSFRVTNRNAPAVAGICHHLDGIPLAIELAAARLRSLSAEEVHDRLDQRFRLLTGGSRTALPRQQTLRALIDWSFDLLRPQEQVLFCRLAVFAGGWTLDAAEAVAADDVIAAPDLVELLGALVDKSLVAAEERDGVTRYRMLETIRQYALEKLVQREQAEACRQRQLAWLLDLATRAEPQLTGAHPQPWLDAIAAEHDNVRAALGWSLAAEPLQGMRLMARLFWFWHIRAHLTEGRQWLTALLAAAPEAPPAARSAALTNMGSLAWQQGDYTAARDALERSVAILQAAGDRQRASASYNNLGLVARDVGDYAAAQRHFEQSLAIDREFAKPHGAANALSNLGMVAKDRGDYAAAHRHYRESLAIRREIDDSRGIALTLNNLGALSVHEGDNASGQRFLEEALAIRRSLGDRRGLASTLHNLAAVKLAGNEPAAALDLNVESLAIREDIGDKQGIAACLVVMATIALAQGDPARSRTFLTKSLATAKLLGDPTLIAACLRVHGEFARVLNRSDESVRIWAASESIRDEAGAPLPPSERVTFDEHLAAARDALGVVAFDAAWAEGRAMTQQEAIEHVLRDNPVFATGAFTPAGALNPTK